jgi:hypothetical protein
MTVTTKKLLVTALGLGWLLSTAAMAQDIDSPQPTAVLGVGETPRPTVDLVWQRERAGTGC